MSECTEHLGDPLASKKGPGLNQQDSPGGGRSACNSTGGIEQEGGGGWEEGEGRLPGIPEPTHHLPIPGFPFLSRHWETWRGCPGLPGSFSGQSAFGKKNAGFCWGGVGSCCHLACRKGTHRHGGETRDPKTAASGQPNSLKTFSSFFWHINQAPFGCKCQTT